VATASIPAPISANADAAAQTARELNCCATPIGDLLEGPCIDAQINSMIAGRRKQNAHEVGISNPWPLKKINYSR